MTDTLMGVIIGGSIALIMPVISLIYSHHVWKREKKVERLEYKKKEYEKLFNKGLKEIGKFLRTKTANIEILDFESRMPEEILQEYRRLIDDKNKFDVKKSKNNYWLLSLSMRRYVQSIDDEIDKAVGL